MEIVKIGGKEWTSRNLDVIVPDSWDYNNDPVNREKYGRQYTWDAAKAAIATLGDGWRLPTRNDWAELIKAAGGFAIASTDLKASAPNWDGTDVLGFSALPGGRRWYDGSFNDLGVWGSWWSATEYDAALAWYVFMGTGYTYVVELWYYKSEGFSVRCVRNVI